MKRFAARCALGDASPAQAWELLRDVLRWPQWTPTIRSVGPLDGDELASGRRFRVLQPRLQPQVWTVTAVQPQRRFTWEARSPGLRMVADHVLSPGAIGGLELRLVFDVHGLLAWPVAALLGQRVQAYLDTEASAFARTLHAVD